MVKLTLNLPDELIKYIDSRIDHKLILNRTDAIRTLIFEHKDEHLTDIKEDLGIETREEKTSREI